MITSKNQTKNSNATATKARVANRSAKTAPPNAKPARKTAHAKKPAAHSDSSKTTKILDLLKRAGGVTLKELVKATDWQPNSVRGFLSGAIRKKLGMPLESFKNSKGDRSYRMSSK